MAATADRGGDYLGSAACGQCHRERTESYAQTTHARSLAAATAAGLADVPPGASKVHTRRPDLWYEVRREEDELRQTSIEMVDGQPVRRSERAELVMGSGKLGVAFFYWRDDALFQMPLVYLPLLGQWTNAPGFSDNFPWWDRPILPRCLECHATHFTAAAGGENHYEPPQPALLAISCERCHGPAAEHVAWHQAHPGAETGEAIRVPSQFDRQRQLEVCAQCHGAIGQARRPAFSYLPGESLDDYIEVSHDDANRAFVHSANQLQRLTQSACFQQSSTMTCTSCHDPHVHERDELAVFSARCQACHEAEAHPLAAELGSRLVENCLDCHMPKRDDNSTPFKLASEAKLNLLELRDHRVGIYPDATQRVRQAWADPQAPAAVGEPAELVARRKVADSWLGKAREHLAAGRAEAALAAVDEGLKLLPAEPRLHELAGGLALEAGRPALAIERFARAVDLAPDRAEATLALGLACLRANDPIRAATVYRQGLERLPASVDLQNALAWLLATSPLETLRDGSEARRLAEGALSAAPERADVLDTLAAACAEAGDWPAAISAGERAVAAYEAAGQPDKAAASRARLEGYRAGQPAREPSP